MSKSFANAGAVEKAMHQRFAARIEAGLQKLERRIDRSKKPLVRTTIDRQLGRLLQRNSRAAARYQIELIDDTTTTGQVVGQFDSGVPR